MIRYGGCIWGQEEIEAVTRVLRSGNWACGQVTEQFEEAAATWQGRRHALFVNSGSSALLLAMAALPERSRIAMPALQFATLYSAARRMGHQPVLVDIDDTLNMDPAWLDVKPGIDAVAFVHMAGNPSDAAAVRQVCEKRGLLLLEDGCEALGAVENRTLAGNFGHASAFSTHGAHHISTGEGGLVFTDDEQAYRKMRSLRDWGRAPAGTGLPSGLEGYYPGYVFSELGFNLHATDIQAALGLVQLARVEGFIDARKANWAKLHSFTEDLPFDVPARTPGADPSWFTFPMRVGLREERDRLISWLAAREIESRPVVAGNMARQLYDGMPTPYQFPCAESWFQRGLWVSVHPKLSQMDLSLIARALHAFWGKP